MSADGGTVELDGVQAYVFDLFGTLVGTEKQAWTKVWDAHFESYSHVYVGEMKGFLSRTDFATDGEALDAVLAHLGTKFSREQRTAFFEDLEEWKEGTEVYDGAEDLLLHLKDSGYGLALLSNQSRFSEDILERHSLTQYFDVVVRSHKVGMAKPEKDIYLHTLKELGVEPQNALMAGDNLDKDVRNPKRLIGMRGILFDPDNRYPSYQPKVRSWKEFQNRYVR